jgi:tight adherence protein B
MAIPLALSTLLATGLWLIYDALTGGPALRARARAATGPRTRALARFMARAGVRPGDVSERDYALYSAGWGLCGFLGSQLVLRWSLVALVVGLIAALVPTLFYARRADRRRARLQAELVEAIGLLRDAIRAGLSPGAAFQGLADDGPEGLRREFARLVAETRLAGPAAALEALRERLADPLADDVVQALILSDQLGGRTLGPVLDHLARSARAELGVLNELRAHQSRTVTQARFLAALPIAVLAAVRAVAPEYLAVFDGPGQVVLAGCGLSVAVGYALMLRVTRVAGDERLFG